jgi:hypothetical protein
MKCALFSALISLLFTGCLFTGNDDISTKHLIQDFYLQNNTGAKSLIHRVPDAQTDGIVIGASVQAIAYNQNFILAQQKTLEDSSTQYTTFFHIVDIRDYKPKKWDTNCKVYTHKGEDAFKEQGKQLGIPDSLYLNFFNTNSQ